MNAAIDKILGPRVPADELRNHAGRYLLPTILLIIAGILLGASYFQPYWKMKLEAAQYPKGLYVQAYLNRLTGDVKEIDGLNHYIGMRPLNDAAQFERQTSWMMVIVVAGLLVAAIFVHNRWAALAALPALLFPVGFLADLQFWLASFGTNLDPHAALSSSIKPFVPPVLGVGIIGQFKTIAVAGPGLWIATAAAAVVLAALFFHRRAYKPLVEARAATRQASTHGAATVAVLMSFLLIPNARAESTVWHGQAAPVPHADGETRDSRLAVPLHPRDTAKQSREGQSPNERKTARLLDGATPSIDAAGFSNNLNALIQQAESGATIRVTAGSYRGPIDINKPVVLIADGVVNIDGGRSGDCVRITAPDATIRGFHIRGTGDSLDQQNTGIAVLAPRATVEDNTLEDVLLGISLSGAPGSLVRNNRVHGKPLDPSRRGDGIRLWSSDNSTVEGNTVVNVRDVVVWYSKGVRLVGNEVRDSRYGLHFMYANDGHVENNYLHENSVGIFLMYSRDVLLKGNRFELNRGPSGYGIGLKDMDGVATHDNLIVGNRVGLYVDNSPSRMDVVQEFRHNVFAFNDIGLAFLPAVQRNNFVENEFLDNLEQIAILGTGELKNNAFTLAGRGNYWSDYVGFDANDDGIGDMPFRAMSLFESWIDREPNLRLFLYSPAQQAIELASRAFPIVQPQAKITDTAPLMRSPMQKYHSSAAGTSWSLSGIAAAVLGAAALVYGGIRKRREGTENTNSLREHREHRENTHDAEVKRIEVWPGQAAPETSAVADSPSGRLAVPSSAASTAKRSRDVDTANEIDPARSLDRATPQSELQAQARGAPPQSTAVSENPDSVTSVTSVAETLLCGLPAILTIRNLRKTFARHAAVDGISLDVQPGQALALWGTNGAGKTTIIKCILGLHGFAGEIRVGPHDARNDGKSARRQIGYVSQELSFYDDLSVIETTSLFADLKRVARVRAAEVLKQVDLHEHAHKRVSQLSGGMKQRLALAVAVLADPPILLFDEPTSNLDAAARRAFFDLLRQLKQSGKTIVFTTHRADEIGGLADRVIVLERGRIVRDIAAAEFDAACTLRIVMPPAAHESAETVLAQAGFEVKRNCRALLVRVPAIRNAAPIAHLTRAGYDIQTVEIESGEH